MGKRKYDLTGKKYNRLTVLEYIKNGKYRCMCDCGKECVVSGTALVKNRAYSCGCYKDERIGNLNRRHGGCGTKLYAVWNAMKARCENKNDYHYKWYGARGIHVCDEWRKFDDFQSWALSNGYKEGLTIDRINVDEGYSPENCRWDTMDEQANNKSTNIKLDYNGQRFTVKEVSAMTGLKRQTIEWRLHHGWTVNEIIETPRFKRIHPHVN